MKKSAFLIAFLIISFMHRGLAQGDIPVVRVNENISTHFISDYELEYMDISTNHVVGDFPLKNVLRIKPKQRTNMDLGVVTIITETEYRQYRLIYVDDSQKADKTIRISIEANTTFNNLDETLNSVAIKDLAQQMMERGPSINAVVSKKNRQKLKLNNIWVIKDYIFVDYALSNNTNIPYSIDEIRYKISDKKVRRKRSNQDVEVRPEYTHQKEEMFLGEHRNIVVFKKFTFPDNKYFTINVAEDQISGREIRLDIAYSDLLNANSFKS
ncbi:conjugative transposon protein TraN [Maribacter polysaccharolyticus]|uniref:conjugative transposon protein TraN n=1 Tax=Maribacter polysaccharolyticus TaxID=3020831 RepID=UPI00237F4720|nr:conjugative transposon protein TraN [Maribacter polysaccharolyticus]MDE3744035.1 conjugative transposon protein TraN [Maribacter polysaccharolyticus]